MLRTYSTCSYPGYQDTTTYAALRKVNISCISCISMWCHNYMFCRKFGKRSRIRTFRGVHHFLPTYSLFFHPGWQKGHNTTLFLFKRMKIHTSPRKQGCKDALPLSLGTLYVHALHPPNRYTHFVLLHVYAFVIFWTHIKTLNRYTCYLVLTPPKQVLPLASLF